MSLVRVACVVEGHGEVRAVPILVHRIARAIDPSISLQIPEPIRIPKDKLNNPAELKRALELAYRKTDGRGAILLLVDSDDQCPAKRGPELLDQARTARPDIALSVVLAHREYEAWFLAAAESLRGYQHLPADLQSPANPENIRGAKEWLSRHLPRGIRYSETIDQAELTRQLDLETARRADSFDKCYREIERILVALSKPD